MQILNPVAHTLRKPHYESWESADPWYHTDHFLRWEDDVTKQIDRQLVKLGYTGLPQIPWEPVKENPNAELIEWLHAKRAEHVAKMETILGRPTTQEAAEAAIKALEYYET